MAFDRHPIRRVFADKAACNDYVRQILGEDFVALQYDRVKRARDLRLDEYPDAFVIKPNHACGAVIIVDPQAEKLAGLPSIDLGARWWTATVRSQRSPEFDAWITEASDYWLGRNYAYTYGHWEWAYSKIPRRLVVEEFLGFDGLLPDDVKVHVANQQAFLMQVFRDRGGPTESR